MPKGQQFDIAAGRDVGREQPVTDKIQDVPHVHRRFQGEPSNDLARLPAIDLEPGIKIVRAQRDPRRPLGRGCKERRQGRIQGGQRGKDGPGF